MIRDRKDMLTIQSEEDTNGTQVSWFPAQIKTK